MRVNEIFYSLQGEGYHAGRAAVFVRFSGCNLRCPFCDTEHQTFTEMSEEEIVREVLKYRCDFVVITGGEPTLQLTEEFVTKLHENNLFVAIETNGTRKVPCNVDWVTISPKGSYVSNGDIMLTSAQEIKVVMDDEHPFVEPNIPCAHYYIQPCDTGNEERNREIINRCINYIKENQKWKLSLQTQKILNVR